MGAFLAGEIERLPAQNDHDFAVDVEAVKIVVFQRRCVYPVAGEDHACPELRCGVGKAGASIEFLDESKRSNRAVTLQFEFGRTLAEPGAPEGNRLQIAAVHTRRQQPHVAKLAGDVIRSDVVALGARLTAAQKVVGQKGDVCLEAPLQGRVIAALGSVSGSPCRQHERQDEDSEHEAILVYVAQGRRITLRLHEWCCGQLRC